MGVGEGREQRKECEREIHIIMFLEEYSFCWFHINVVINETYVVVLMMNFL